MSIESARSRRRDQVIDSPRTETNRKRSTGIRTMEQANRSAWESLGFDRGENKKNTGTPFINVEGVDTLGMRRKADTRPTRKHIKPMAPNHGGTARPTWETQRKALKAAVDEQVRKAEKEIRLKQKYSKKNNPVVDNSRSTTNYFNTSRAPPANDKPTSSGNLFYSSALAQSNAY